MTTDFYTGPDGQPYKLEHLQTQRYEIKLKIEEQIYDVPVVLTFSNHCYTDDQNEDGSSAQPEDPWFCLTDDKGHRVFCKTRWKASLSLPDYLHTIIDKKLDCYKARNGIFVRIHDNDRDKKYAGWYVFFAFSAANDRGPSIVRINISSHHHRRRLPDSVQSPLKRVSQ